MTWNVNLINFQATDVGLLFEQNIYFLILCSTNIISNRYWKILWRYNRVQNRKQSPPDFPKTNQGRNLNLIFWIGVVHWNWYWQVTWPALMLGALMLCVSRGSACWSFCLFIYISSLAPFIVSESYQLWQMII